MQSLRVTLGSDAVTVDPGSYGPGMNPANVQQGSASIVDVLDRVLDKGIVIDAWIRVSLVGIDLLTVEARVLVASIDTYLKHADALVGNVGTTAAPPLLRRA